MEVNDAFGRGSTAAQPRRGSDRKTCATKEEIDHDVPFHDNPILPPGTVIVAVLPLLLALVVTAGAEPGNDNRTPVLEGEWPKLAVEAGNKVIAHGFATGAQIYRWTGVSWEFVAPDAVLYLDEGLNGVLASHFAGPTWKSLSGSEVVVRRRQEVHAGPRLDSLAAPEGDQQPRPRHLRRRDIHPGREHRGRPGPYRTRRRVGDLAAVPYTAEYYFYRAQ